VGTSLSDRKGSSQQQEHSYLGPNQKLLAAKREETERERRSRLEQGRGGDRRHDCGGRGSREERERALEEMERSARDRDRRFR